MRANMAAWRTCGLHQTSYGNLTFSCTTGNTCSGRPSLLVTIHYTVQFDCIHSREHLSDHNWTTIILISSNCPCACVYVCVCTYVWSENVNCLFAKLKVLYAIFCFYFCLEANLMALHFVFYFKFRTELIDATVN